MEGLDDTEGKSEGERTTKDKKDTKGKWSQAGGVCDATRVGERGRFGRERTTNLTNLTVHNEPYAPAATITSLPNLNGSAAMTGNAYAGTISGGALSGTINGNFYGTAAQETAGVWQASGGGNLWVGSFGAK